MASALGGIVDQIIDGESGLLVSPPHDLAQFGDAVNRLLNDPELAAGVGAAGRQRVIDRFLPDTSFAEWQQLLVTVLALPP